MGGPKARVWCVNVYEPRMLACMHVQINLLGRDYMYTNKPASNVQAFPLRDFRPFFFLMTGEELGEEVLQGERGVMGQQSASRA